MSLSTTWTVLTNEQPLINYFYTGNWSRKDFHFVIARQFHKKFKEMKHTELNLKYLSRKTEIVFSHKMCSNNHFFTVNFLIGISELNTF